MKPPAAIASMLMACLGILALAGFAKGSAPTTDERNIEGWVVKISAKLIEQNSDQLEKAVLILQAQLKEIVATVPKAAVTELRKVTLYVSPEYPSIPPRAEYHPDAGWLKKNGRSLGMAKGIEFTNVRIFEAEARRMPNFALHELAHAYHDRVIGNDEPRIKACYEKAKRDGKYEKVQRRDDQGRLHMERAYAMTNHLEYFAECTEAFFSTNDFFPYHKEELQQHDPEMYALLGLIWQISEAKKS